MNIKINNSKWLNFNYDLKYNILTQKEIYDSLIKLWNEVFNILEEDQNILIQFKIKDSSSQYYKQKFHFHQKKFQNLFYTNIDDYVSVYNFLKK